MAESEAHAELVGVSPNPGGNCGNPVLPRFTELLRGKRAFRVSRRPAIVRRSDWPLGKETGVGARLNPDQSMRAKF